MTLENITLEAILWPTHACAHREKRGERRRERDQLEQNYTKQKKKKSILSPPASFPKVAIANRWSNILPDMSTLQTSILDIYLTHMTRIYINVNHPKSSL